MKDAKQVHYITLRGEHTEGAEEYFYKWEKLGETIIQKDDLKELLKDLTQGYEEGKKLKEQALCFIPRHALKVNSKEKLEIIVCFACNKLRIITDEKTHYYDIKMERNLFDKVAEKYNLKLDKP